MKIMLAFYSPSKGYYIRDSGLQGVFGDLDDAKLYHPIIQNVEIFDNIRCNYAFDLVVQEIAVERTVTSDLSTMKEIEDKYWFKTDYEFHRLETLSNGDLDNLDKPQYDSYRNLKSKIKNRIRIT
jgi:hypothetical protein